MNILFFQHGDYGEAYQRFQAGGSATYRDQKTSVELVKTFSQSHDVTVASIRPEPHDLQLTKSLRSLGVRYDDLSGPRLAEILDETAPDRVICRTPDWRILHALRRRRIATLPYFADTFRHTGLRGRFRSLRLRRTLGGDHIPCVCNHSRNASLSLHEVLGIAKARIVPWDRRVIETGLGPKPAPAPGAPLRLFYAGMLIEAKGTGDVLAALAALQADGVPVTLSLASRTDPGPWRARAEALGIAERVDFLGSIPNEDILDAMRAHDVILVPTRHSYAEGLPNTLREALAVRTPLITSDHPAFAGRLEPDRDALIFRGGDPQALARAIRRLAETPALYERLSASAEAALERLPYGLYWDDLWRCFLADPAPGADWVRQSSLEALERRSQP
jgi:glycosyltransferase involved in cell wall biosynthesis